MKRGHKIVLPTDRPSLTFEIEGKQVHLTNLLKPFWPEQGITKGMLLQYYADIADYLLPHVKNRAMVMKRYPHGYSGEFFFMKRTPAPKPDWLETCAIEHASGNVIDFPMIQDLAALLWIVNLGCIDLNPWYSRCDDVHRPDYLHFDLDPVDKAAVTGKVLEAARIVHDELEALGIVSYAKSTGSRGIHVYVPIKRGPLQKEVWTFAKSFAIAVARRYPGLITSEYRIAKRPPGHVLVDYNQNAWGRTLASVYSVRPKPEVSVSAPVTWKEIDASFRIEDFTLRNMPDRLKLVGDLWKPLLAANGRVDLKRLVADFKAA